VALEGSYNPAEFEREIYDGWEASGAFKATADKDKPTFMITMPPPNVTGVLHMGHALFVSLQDTYTRWKRMCGYNTLWLPGTDHAGIATQLMVEKQLEKEGDSRQKLGREKFLKRVWEWKAEYGGEITEQIRALGASCDWSRELFTLDDKSSRAVRESFCRLYHDGLIYRGERLINWSSGLQTAISDLEVEKRPVEGKMYHLKYMLSDGSGDYLTVATTRPETVFADVAVAVHPEDQRYKSFHGKSVVVPLDGRHVPVILDDYVDMEFGSGALKITPGHDQADWQIGKRHNLKTISVIDKDAKLTEEAGEFKGMIAVHARKKVVEKMASLGLIVKEDKHSQEIGYCQRSGVIVEPLISVQWFVKMEKMAKMGLQAAEGENPAIRFYPDYWKKTWHEWLANIQDWCISRQLWWGHQIPAWHCNDCHKVTVPINGAETDPKTCEHCESKNITQDPDVLDTWYSSGLWPISTLGWPEETKDFEIFYPKQRYDHSRKKEEPMALMETGSDILFFWVARMVMMCTYLTEGRVPFEDVFMHAMVRDEKGQKMSKTKGNVIDPLDVTEKSGSDPLRLTLLALSGQGRNVNLDLKRLEGYKGFLNKLWNASKFLFMQLEATEKTNFKNPLESKDLDFVDRWLLTELDRTIGKINEALTQYRPDAAFQELYHFVWHELCDWYVELIKAKNGKLDTMCFALEEVLKLLHPMAPMVTEKIYRELPWAGKTASLVNAEFPKERNKEIASAKDLEAIATLKQVTEGLRNFRTENKISPRTEINAFLETKNSALWNEIGPLVTALARLGEVKVADAPKGTSGRVATENFVFSIPLEGLVDKDAERQRLQNEIKKARSDVEFSEKRLGNPGFIQKAKPELVDQEKANLSIYKEKLASLEEALSKL
jgi:valyl-tRNA synthetase